MPFDILFILLSTLLLIIVLNRRVSNLEKESDIQKAKLLTWESIYRKIGLNVLDLKRQIVEAKEKRQRRRPRRQRHIPEQTDKSKSEEEKIVPENNEA